MSTVLATPSYVKYETVPGYFLQDLDSTKATTFNFTQWERFARQVWQLNEESHYEVEYKVLFIGRHGEGYHNTAESYYDAQLTPNGITQAQAVNAFWAKQITEEKIPTPQKFYTSPLSRCCATAALTFTGLTLPASQPFIPEVKELLREWIIICPILQRIIRLFTFEEGFQEVDPLWNATFVETSSAQNERSRTVLDDIFMNDPSTYNSITTHSGEAASMLSVLAVIPILVRAETVTGRPPFRTWQPWTMISTCAMPPPSPTPTTDDVKWSGARMMRIQ
ncbi:histidine phosphatase superfamily [Lipomyces mesembrius]